MYVCMHACMYACMYVYIDIGMGMNVPLHRYVHI